MSKISMPVTLLCALTVLTDGAAVAYMPPQCRPAMQMSNAKTFVDPHLMPSQLTSSEAARYRRLPADGRQRRIFLLVHGYLRLCAQIIDGRMKPGAVSADDIELVELVGQHDLVPSERAIFARAAARSRRAALAVPVNRCVRALVHAVDAPPPAPLAPLPAKSPP